MTIIPSSDPVITLTIELLPEFGYKIQDEPVYGPGSVFQGIVHLRLKESPVAADRIVLTFRGAEHATPIHDGNKFLVPLIKNPFFSMQQTLWQRTREECLLTERHYRFPFTIQMPMTQFPPSMDHSLYQCQFDLSAKLIRTTFTLPTVVTKRTIHYMPCIETSALKQPIIEDGYHNGFYASVRLHSLDYVPGDSIPITLTTSRRDRRHRRRRQRPPPRPLAFEKEKQQKQTHVHVAMKSQHPIQRNKQDDPLEGDEEEPAEATSILVELCEKVELLRCKAVSVTRVVATHVEKPTTTGYKYALTKTLYGSGAEYRVALPLPVDLTPSINYSKIVHLSYLLRIKIKSRGTSLLGPMFSSVVQMELPLKIGTLGYGIRASRDLKVYYADTVSSPRFLRSLEYEEALPLYDPSRLPSYHDSPITV
ncbi:hypothetical protein BDF20DRAFT_855682 [Mycotypha africana]|uniref:uncharacterized protein n=1 Tax=Mycotypha africana TaxID=64632 RepID=UPI002301163A|nr:uncharacterized protein BDF20DRAFT_855682 [Mycotypha africana]KAI8988437.1 hypothetical protein BDF20DRAFT_855682 [Mycotypha africana]